MIELDFTLTREDLDCLGWHRVGDDDWRVFSAADRLEALVASATPQRRVRRLSLESTVRQILKAARAAGVPIAVTIEGDTVTASPIARAPAPREDRTPGEQPDAPPPRSLFKTRVRPKQKVVL